MKYLRIINTDPSDGYSNMALDEAILLNYLDTKIPVLRFYNWKPSFISIGYFQNPDVVIKAEQCSLEKINFTRRITGGGAILHDKELTYSIVCSDEDLNLPVSVKESYRKLCSFIIDTYKNFGLDAKFACQENVNNKKISGIPTAFCFAGIEHYDILVNGKKLGGNAQRRKKNIIFQHGSIPLEIDFWKIKNIFYDIPHDLEKTTTSLKGLLADDISFEKLRTLLILYFQKNFQIETRNDIISEKENKIKERLLLEKYKTEKWNSLSKKNIAVYQYAESHSG